MTDGGTLVPFPVSLPDRASPRTLAELAPVFLKWFRLIRRRAENTVRGYGADLDSFLTFCDQAGVTMPDEVRVQHVEFYMGLLQEQRGLQAASVNRHLHALRSFWKWMLREEIVTSNPAALAFLLKQPTKLPRYLPVPQQERLLTALSHAYTAVGVRDYALHAVGLLCGLRCSELSKLRLTELDLETGVVRIVDAKGGKDREVPVIPSLVSILTTYLAKARPVLLGGRPNEYVFVRAGSWTKKHEGQPLATRAIFHLVRRTLKRVLGDEKAHPHMLRHSFASRVREHEGTIQDLQEALGHANIATTARYAHLVTASQRARLAKFITG